MTIWPVSVSAFWSKFNNPYFGPGSTENFKILEIIFFHGIQQPHQKSFKSVTVMSDFNSKRVDLAWIPPITFIQMGAPDSRAIKDSCQRNRLDSTIFEQLKSSIINFFPRCKHLSGRHPPTLYVALECSVWVNIQVERDQACWQLDHRVLPKLWI